MDRQTAQDWLDRYVAAWRTYDPEAVAALFSVDVAYRYHPYDEPVVGRDAVVASWLGQDGTGDDSGDASEDAAGDDSGPDEPDTYDAAYSPVAVDGDTVVATGTTRYQDVPGGPVVRVYDNCFVIRFDRDGRCREFTEYYVRRP